MIVIEIQKSESAIVCPPIYHADKNTAWQAYHQALAAAAVSSVPAHSVIIMDDEANPVEHKTFYHQAPED